MLKLWGVYYSGIKIFNHLPQNIKNLSWNVEKFKLAVKRFLLMGSFNILTGFPGVILVLLCKLFHKFLVNKMHAARSYDLKIFS